MVELLMRSRILRTPETGGFTLIEVMVSITILAVGILALGGLLLRSSRTAEAASAVSYQTAALAAEAGRYDAIPFAQLVAGTTCTTVTAHPLPHSLCTTVTNVSAKVRQVMVKVTPTGNPLLPADSVMFERSISGNGTPLATP
jgi:prepilin-type N-terminal cleavage/methylation domain-containing protein